jgi:hypothetical protein
MNEANDRKKGEPYDLSEEASRRGGEASTEEARFQESDEASEMGQRGLTDRPEGDNWAENGVATSIDDE